jgi:hypothetical protein
VKLRHAAALALVGWYLMAAPPMLNKGGSSGPDLGAPLSKWTIEESFDTAKECEAADEKLKTRFLDARPQTLAGIEWAQGISCIATDDPRLKGK